MKISATFSLRKLNINFWFLVLLFITCLGSLSDNYILQFILKHIDEILTLVLLIYIILNIKTVVEKKSYLLCIFIFFSMIGFISSILWQYQSVVPVLIDAILLIGRFIIGYFSIIIYADKTNKSFSDSIIKLGKIIVFILFGLLIHDILLTPIFPKSDFRFFMYGVQLMFPHATYLAATAAVLLIFFGYKNTKYQYIPYMIMSTIIGISTLRGKALGFFAVYWFLYIFIYFFKFKNSILIYFCGFILAVFIAKDQFSTYFGALAYYSPRLILLKDGVQLMLTHFPFGTGFATFGSAVAFNYYSPLYTSLGYQSNYGMNSSDGQFLTDTFWPIIFAQFGILGFIVFCMIIIYFIQLAVKQFRSNKNSGFAMLMVLSYLLITSFGETSFFNPTALLFFMLFAIYEKNL